MERIDKAFESIQESLVHPNPLVDHSRVLFEAQVWANNGTEFLEILAAFLQGKKVKHIRTVNQSREI